jgi:hypothetical protein
MKQLGKELARCFVYGCNGNQYVALIDQFRLAKTRLALLEAIFVLLKYEDPTTKSEYRMARISPQRLKNLCLFIRKEEINNVRHLHEWMIRHISVFEMEKIKKTEQYLMELLVESE